MSSKTESLLKQLYESHEKINKMYSNIIAIEGQYDNRLKTVASVLKLQFNTRKDCYYNYLRHASDEDADLSDDGYENACNVIKNYKGNIGKKKFKSDDGIIKFAIEHSNDSIKIFISFVKLIEAQEISQNISHDSLKGVLERMILMEKKDIATLETFE